MNIQTVIERDDAYIINGHTTVVKGSGHRFLIDIANWEAQGNTPEPYVEPPAPIPTSATPAQGLMALYQLKGITEDDIEAAIAGIADPAERYAAQIAYRKTTVWERGSTSMLAIGALLQLTEQDFDDLFTLAATIKL